MRLDHRRSRPIIPLVEVDFVGVRSNPSSMLDSYPSLLHGQDQPPLVAGKGTLPDMLGFLPLLGEGKKVQDQRNLRRR